jgi:hypothetical protein
MNMADIWAYCSVAEREPDHLMLKYKWYYGGLRVIGLHTMQDIENAFSEYPYRVREQLKLISWAHMYEYLWELVNTASHWLDPPGKPSEMQYYTALAKQTGALPEDYQGPYKLMYPTNDTKNSLPDPCTSSAVS